MPKSAAKTSDREIVISRTLNAPLALVWRAWTEPDHLIKWWGPNGFTNTFHSIDFRPGGVWDYTMHGPDGVNYPNWVRFDDIVKHERIAYTHGENANDPKMFQGLATFEETGGKTTVTLRLTLPTVEALEEVKKFGAVEGGNQTLGRLDVYVATMQ